VLGLFVKLKHMTPKPDLAIFKDPDLIAAMESAVAEHEQDPGSAWLMDASVQEWVDSLDGESPIKQLHDELKSTDSNTRAQIAEHGEGPVPLELQWERGNSKHHLDLFENFVESFISGMEQGASPDVLFDCIRDSMVRRAESRTHPHMDREDEINFVTYLHELCLEQIEHTKRVSQREVDQRYLERFFKEEEEAWPLDAATGRLETMDPSGPFTMYLLENDVDMEQELEELDFEVALMVSRGTSDAEAAANGEKGPQDFMRVWLVAMFCETLNLKEEIGYSPAEAVNEAHWYVDHRLEMIYSRRRDDIELTEFTAGLSKAFEKQLDYDIEEQRPETD
jgi:hypothetical protein